MLQHLPNWVPPVSLLSRCPLCVAYFTSWHTPVQWHVTRWGLGQFLGIASRAGKSWDSSAVPNNTTCNGRAAAAERLLPMHHRDTCWSQKDLFCDRKSQNKKAWLQAQQSHLLGASLQKHVRRLGHSFLDYKIYLYSTEQHWESFPGLITRTPTSLFIWVLCSQLLHPTHWTHLFTSALVGDLNFWNL